MVIRVLLAGASLLFGLGIIADGRTIEFAGREWSVRAGNGGPGPNNWSDSAESVWVDEAGLHLKIRKVGETWYCAEVTSIQPTRYGMHRFFVASRVDQLDKNVVASPFLYKDDEHELDIEFSRWSSASAKAAQYVVQPYTARGNRHRFDIRLSNDCTTHCIVWQPDAIRFESFHGHFAEPPEGSLIQDWTYAGPHNPRETDNLRIHINLWLIKGAPPSDGKEAEFILKTADLPSPPEK